MAENNLEKLIINYLTEEQYIAALEAGTLNDNDLYCTSDIDTISLEERVQELETIISTLEARIAALESGQVNNVAVNPTDTSNMNMWVETE